MSMLDELLEAERDAEELRAEDVQRLRSALHGAISAGAHLGLDTMPDTSTVQSATDAASAGSAMAPWLKGLLLVALGAGAGSLATYEVMQAEEPVTAAPHESEAPASVGQTGPPAAEPPDLAGPEHTFVEPVSAPRVTPLNEPVNEERQRAEPTQHLANERALIDSARQALVRNESEAALSTLRRHRRRHRRGALREERDALEVVALAQGGQELEARRLGRRFLTRYPGSLLGGTVRSAVAELSSIEEARERPHETSDDE